MRHTAKPQRQSAVPPLRLARATHRQHRVFPVTLRLRELDGRGESDQLPVARAVPAENEHTEELFAAALTADLMRWPWVKARLELAFGAWLRRQRRVAESRHPLRAAQSAFDTMGAPAWAEQARTELRAAGERLTQETTPAIHTLLSPQELQIARLVAEGLTNKDIGERLYLSPRTVSSHLYRIFPKLNITSRAQIAVRLMSG
jgi:DNA-binding CsgD family transcriptional regulator